MKAEASFESSKGKRGKITTLEGELKVEYPKDGCPIVIIVKQKLGKEFNNEVREVNIFINPEDLPDFLFQFENPRD